MPVTVVTDSTSYIPYALDYLRREGRILAGWAAEVTGSEPEIIPIGPVIGLHVGPGTVALTYETERPLRGEA